MNAVMFAMKRAHHGGLQVARSLLRGTGMTPARFDLVQVLARRGPVTARIPCGQGELWGHLGVSQATVSRMVRSLVKLGMLKQMRDREDGRRKLVQLTEAGVEWFRRAWRQAFQRADERTRLAIGEGTPEARGEAGPGWHGPGITWERFERLLHAIRWRFWGRGSAVYAWAAFEGEAAARDVP